MRMLSSSPASSAEAGLAEQPQLRQDAHHAAVNPQRMQLNSQHGCAGPRLPGRPAARLGLGGSVHLRGGASLTERDALKCQLAHQVPAATYVA